MTFLIIGWYLLIGILVHLFLPKPPRAKEAFRMAEEIEPGFSFLVAISVVILWPAVVIGALLRFFR